MSIPENAFKKCFDDWIIRWHKYIIPEGAYFKGNKINFGWIKYCDNELGKICFRIMSVENIVFIQWKLIASWKWVKIKKKLATFWNFITKKGRMQLSLLKKFVIFMDMTQYQYVWHKAGSSKTLNTKLF